jgi:hypothetical protein
MEQFDYKKFLVENRLTPNSRLQEVGEGTSTPYPYSTDDDYYYNFTTDKGTEYEVELMSRFITNEFISIIPEGKAIPMLYVSFVADDDYGQTNIINKGEMYRVMATVIKIIKENLSQNPQIGGIYFSPTNKGDNNQDLNTNQRYKLYQSYITKQIPNSKIITVDGESYIFFPGWEDKMVEDEGYD